MMWGRRTAYRSHLITATALLSQNLGLKGCSQSGLLASEFSMKAVLKTTGFSDVEIRKLGHNYRALGDAVLENVDLKHHQKFDSIIDQLPDFVLDRYSTETYDKVGASKLMMLCQFVSGECARNLTQFSVSETFTGNLSFER